MIDDSGNFFGQVDLMDAVVFLVYFSKKTQELLVALGLQPEDKQVNFSGLLADDEDLKDLFDVYENTSSLASTFILSLTSRGFWWFVILRN